MNGVRSLAQIVLRRWESACKRLVPRLIKSGYSPTPRYIYIQLTYKCNLRCSFCGQWGDTGIFKNLPAGELKQVLPLSLLRRVIDELHPSCEAVGLWGGETLEYPDIIPLIRHIKERGKSCNLVTNGTFLPKHARALVEAGIDGIDISLDACEETHDKMRGARGTFKAAIEGIQQLKAECTRRGSSTPRIAVSTVLIPEAASELPALVQQVREAGADSIMLSRMEYTTAQQGTAHEKVFQDLFQITPSSWRGFTTRVEPDSSARIKAVVEELCADPGNKDFLCWWEPTWSPQDLFNYYKDPTTAVPADWACRFPWDGVSICPNGDVTPCPDYPDMVVGNVKEDSFRSIWNSPRFLKFRRQLAKHRRFPVCTSCCHLYK
jgi:radical SAM protein with 4Fe4S-binding SPASM domain